MADHSEVLRGIHRARHVRYPVLTPNMRGFQDAVSIYLLSMYHYLSDVSSSFTSSIPPLLPVFARTRGGERNAAHFHRCACSLKGYFDILRTPVSVLLYRHPYHQSLDEPVFPCVSLMHLPSHPVGCSRGDGGGRVWFGLGDLQQEEHQLFHRGEHAEV